MVTRTTQKGHLTLVHNGVVDKPADIAPVDKPLATISAHPLARHALSFAGIERPDGSKTILRIEGTTAPHTTNLSEDQSLLRISHNASPGYIAYVLHSQHTKRKLAPLKEQLSPLGNWVMDSMIDCASTAWLRTTDNETPDIWRHPQHIMANYFAHQFLKYDTSWPQQTASLTRGHYSKSEMIKDHEILVNDVLGTATILPPKNVPFMRKDDFRTELFARLAGAIDYKPKTVWANSSADMIARDPATTRPPPQKVERNFHLVGKSPDTPEPQK